MSKNYEYWSAIEKFWNNKTGALLWLTYSVRGADV